MGTAGRIACIFTPYVLSLGALICIIFVGLGSTNANSSTLNDLYFFRADLSNLTNTSDSTIANALVNLADQHSSQQLANALEQAEKDLDLQDFYDIGLWNYCSGNKTSNGDFQVTYCAPRQAEYWFNPVAVWKLNNTGVEDLLPDNLQKALNTYESVSKWMFIAYAVAFISTLVELVVGLTAICSRLGSLVTSLVSGVSLLFTVAASVTSTALFVVLTGTFNTALKQYGLHGSMGPRIYAVTWLAVAFSLGSSLFWLLSSCCCSARSPYHGDRRGRRVTAEKAPYTYERVASPYMGATSPAPAYHPGNNVPMQNVRRDVAYEPFRHV
ncbi:hypothetical protein VTN77DRAFT_4494 [Rasamsonia byssochlamydoides]|uniref:uncharacterized protein n=1 Tax=Rasamsonia byssochlamydoides TaxID=89139 RepID=UPI0037447F1D